MARLMLNEALPPEQSTFDPEAAIQRICDSYGFNFYAVCSLGAADIVDSRSVILSNFVAEGIEFLDESRWWDKFESFSDSLRSGRTVHWVLNPPNLKSSPERLQRFADLIADYPVSECLTVPLHCGTRLGAAYLMGEALSFSCHELDVLQLSMLGLFERLCELHPARDMRVTPREIECLAWTSRGNTSQQVAGILSISEHTVVRHLVSATKKLSAANRSQAVAKAIRLGFME
ncbi:MAG: hypothetical protein H7Y08_01560 [Rhizobiaceae bacterium]|nr:hypothetical protein [Rhizobiaceae bacterium]